MAKKIVNIQIRLEYDDVDIFGEELHVADIVDEFTYCLEHSDWDIFENATIEKFMVQAQEVRA